MVDELDYATPEIGIGSITVQLSKDGGAFVTIINAVTEIGHGWYRVLIDAGDMTWYQAVLKATAANVAQCDEIYYMSN